MALVLNVSSLGGADLDYASASALGYTIASYYVDPNTGKLAWVNIVDPALAPGNQIRKWSPSSNNNDLQYILNTYFIWPPVTGYAGSLYEIIWGSSFNNFWRAIDKSSSPTYDYNDIDMARAVLKLIISMKTSSTTFSFPMYSEATPILGTLSPTSGTHNTIVALTLHGQNFYSDSVVKINSTALVTTFVNSTTLTAPTTAASILTAGSYTVTVVNSGTLVSNGLTFTAT